MLDDTVDNTIIRKLFSLGRPRVFTKGEVIFGSGESPDGVHIIDSGYVKTFTISDSGDDYVHIIYGHSEIFPLNWAYLGTYEEPEFYQALVDTVTWRIPRSFFIRLVYSNPKLSWALSAQMARQYQLLSQRVDNLENRKAHERVAYHILSLCSRFGTRIGDTYLIDLPLTHDVFASSVNLSRETVSRHIEKLTEEQVISTANHHFEIINMAALIRKVKQPNNMSSWKM